MWEGPNVNESAPSAMAQRPWIVPEFKLVSNVYILKTPLNNCALSDTSLYNSFNILENRILVVSGVIHFCDGSNIG